MGKYIIGTSFILIFTMIFYQSYLQMATNFTKQSITTIVETHAQMARFQGYFTPEIINSMEVYFSQLKQVDAANIEYNLNPSDANNKKCTRSNSFNIAENTLTYEIIVPIKNVNSKLFGSADRNLDYPQRGTIISELKCGDI